MAPVVQKHKAPLKFYEKRMFLKQFAFEIHKSDYHAYQTKITLRKRNKDIPWKGYGEPFLWSKFMKWEVSWEVAKALYANKCGVMAFDDT